MSEVTFYASEITVTTVSRDQICVTVDANPRDIVDGMGLDDRLYDLDMRDIIDEAGSTKLLDAFTSGELADWVSTSHSDSYVDLLNAIGLDAIHEYLSHVD